MSHVYDLPIVAALIYLAAAITPAAVLLRFIYQNRISRNRGCNPRRNLRRRSEVLFPETQKLESARLQLPL